MECFDRSVIQVRPHRSSRAASPAPAGIRSPGTTRRPRRTLGGARDRRQCGQAHSPLSCNEDGARPPGFLRLSSPLILPTGRERARTLTSQSLLPHLRSCWPSLRSRVHGLTSHIDAPLAARGLPLHSQVKSTLSSHFYIYNSPGGFNEGAVCVAGRRGMTGTSGRVARRTAVAPAGVGSMSSTTHREIRVISSVQHGTMTGWAACSPCLRLAGATGYGS